MTHAASNIEARVLSDLTLVLAPQASLDNSNAHLMVEAITQAQAHGYRFVVVDMHRVTLLSSAGVGSILGTVESFRARGGDIILCQLAPGIRRVLEVLDLVDYLTITASEEEAARRCGAQA